MGVYYHEQHRRYHAQIKRGDTCIYLGEFEDRDMADAMLAEAETTATEDLPALKKKFRALRLGQNGHAKPGRKPHLVGSEPPPVTSERQALVELLQIALACQGALDEARQSCQFLLTQATEAWAAYDQALGCVRDSE